MKFDDYAPPTLVQKAEERMRPQVRRALARFNALRDGDMLTYETIVPPDGFPPVVVGHSQTWANGCPVEAPPPSDLTREFAPTVKVYDGGL